jgi:hypothetical protein
MLLQRLTKCRRDRPGTRIACSEGRGGQHQQSPKKQLHSAPALLRHRPMTSDATPHSDIASVAVRQAATEAAAITRRATVPLRQ